MSGNKKLNGSSFLIGSLVGSILGASAAFLFAPKPGRKLRKDINVRSKEAIEQAGEWKDTVQEKSLRYSDKLMSKGTELKELSSFYMSDYKKIRMASFIMGSCAGGILGASIGLTFAPKPGSELREDINVGSKKAIEKAEEWKDTMQESDTSISDLAMTKGTELINKSVDVTKKAIEKTEDWKQTVEKTDTAYLDNVITKVTEFINNTVSVTKRIINNAKEFSIVAESMIEFFKETTDKTKDLYKDVSDKSRLIAQEVVETSTEIKDEVIDHTKVVAQEAKDLKDDTVDHAKNL